MDCLPTRRVTMSLELMGKKQSNIVIIYDWSNYVLVGFDWRDRCIESCDWGRLKARAGY